MLFDDILEQIGEGIFQKFALVVCGLATLAEAIAATSVPFAVILVSCDLKMTIDQIQELNAVIICGMVISGYWLGGISDISGRKYVLSTTSIITFVGCFVASFSQCVVMLSISLFILGFGLGGNHSATRIFIIEVTTKSCRGSRLMILEVFFAVGYVAAIGFSRLLVPPLADSLLGNNVRLNSWRILFGLSGSLSIFSACLMSVFPASSRWLLGKKQEDDAIDILRKIYAVNKVKHEETFPSIHLDPIMFVSTRPETHVYQCNNSLVRSLQSIRIYTRHIFTKKFLKTTLPALFISIFFFDGLIIMNIWLGLTVFSTEMGKCQLIGASPVVAYTYTQICNAGVLENLFKVNTYLSFCSFILIIMIFVIDRIPRKFILMASSILAGLSLIILVFVRVEGLKISLAFITLSFMFIADVTFRIIILESYPTILRQVAILFCILYKYIHISLVLSNLSRSTAYGFFRLFPKIILMLMILFIQSSCFWVFTIFGILFMVAGLLAMLLPNLNMKPMQD